MAAAGNYSLLTWTLLTLADKRENLKDGSHLNRLHINALPVTEIRIVPPPKINLRVEGLFNKLLFTGQLTSTNVVTIKCF